MIFYPRSLCHLFRNSPYINGPISDDQLFGHLHIIERAYYCLPLKQRLKVTLLIAGGWYKLSLHRDKTCIDEILAIFGKLNFSLKLFFAQKQRKIVTF